MISLFINTSRRGLAIVFFAVVGVLLNCEVFADQKNIFNLPNKGGQIFWKCDNELCNTYLKLQNKNPIIILEKGPSPTVDVLDRNLVRLFFSCGSPCNYTIFYDAKNGLSRAFEFVVALNTTKEIVLIAEKKHLVAYKIFDKTKRPLFSIKKDWSPTVTIFNDIIEAKFIKEGLYIKYLQGPNFIEKDEIIHGKTPIFSLS